MKMIFNWFYPSWVIESERYHHNKVVLSANGRVVPNIKVSTINRKDSMPNDNYRPQRTLQKLKDLSYEILPYPFYSTDISPFHSHFFDHKDNFLLVMWFTDERVVKNVSNEFAYRIIDIYSNGMNILGSYCKNVLFLMAIISKTKV